MRVIIPAAGEGLRFRHYHEQRAKFERDGFRKHFLDLGGETIIGRLIRLFDGLDVWVVGPDDQYDLPGARLFIPTQDPEMGDANKIYNSRELWNPDGRTLVVYGDVYLTDQAAETMMSEGRPWVAFGRRGNHRWTGGPEELFGFAFNPESHPTNRQLLRDIAHQWRTGALPRCAGWEFFGAYGGNPKKWNGYDELWCDIDDLTDDVDTPAQYEALKRIVG